MPLHHAILELPDAAATERAGRTLAQALRPGMVVALSGELGTGKTTLVRGVLRGFDIQGAVKSPTYTLVEPYNVSKIYLYHFDFYRLKDPQEWEAAGFREYFRDDSICLIEWPERVAGLLPVPDLELQLQFEQAGRRLVATANGTRAEPCLAALTAATTEIASSARGSTAGGSCSR
jgi:tRNA threonylcarbamoyladenosine biosynthesis protein TsaE